MTAALLICAGLLSYLAFQLKRIADARTALMRLQFGKDWASRDD